MNAKSKLNFINSVAGHQKIPCPACNSLNEPDASFCAICGTKLFEKRTEEGNSGKIICPACKEANEKDAVFCAFCGKKLNGKEEQITSVVEPPEPKQDAEAEENLDTEAGQEQNTGVEQQIKKTLAFSPVKKPAEDAFKDIRPKKAEEPEEISVFAQGLPSWDIVPPQVMVRRKKR